MRELIIAHIAYYIGQQFRFKYTGSTEWSNWKTMDAKRCAELLTDDGYVEIQLALRPMNSLQGHHRKEYQEIALMFSSAHSVKYLLDRGYDVFDLMELGLAKDVSEIAKEVTT
jgi:hypothetical protein